jgi:hypothetical protein
MANTHNVIATVTVPGGGAATIGFTSIPATYTDLKLVCSTRDDRGGTQNGVNISINGSTSNFTAKQIQADGSLSTPGSFSIARFTNYNNASASTANSFANSEIYFPNYTSSDYKPFLSDSMQETNSTTAYIFLGAHLWSVGSAITSITLTPDSANFVQYSTATLYGIKNS